MVKVVTESMEIYQKDPMSLPLFHFIQDLQHSALQMIQLET